MMSTEPSIPPNNSQDPCSLPSRQRRFKIFQQRPKSESPPEQKLLIESKQSNKIEKEASFSKQEVQESQSKIQFIKIPQKEILQKEFYGEDEEEEIVLLQPNLQGFKTIQSQNFGATDNFFIQSSQPSVFFRCRSLVVNEQSELFQSVSEIKSSFYDLKNYTSELAESISEMDASVRVLVDQGQSSGERLRQIQQFLMETQKQKEVYEKRIEDLDQRIQNLQLQQSLSKTMLDKSQQGQELKVFIEEKGYRVQMDDQEDQIVESQILPAALIAEFMEHRRKKAQQDIKKSQTIKQQKQLKFFHPCLDITDNTLSTLKTYISQEFKGKQPQDVSLELIFKRSTIDLDQGFFGQKQTLQYKQSLLFILRNGSGKVIGGFISNYLIEEEIRQDPHAFLFSITSDCCKFKVKSEFENSAYEASKHYLVCFGSDLMISSACIHQQSYCEWPSSYEGREGDSSMNWLAGDFTFMIEHIEVYQITIK